MSIQVNDKDNFSKVWHKDSSLDSRVLYRLLLCILHFWNCLYQLFFILLSLSSMHSSEYQKAKLCKKFFVTSDTNEWSYLSWDFMHWFCSDRWQSLNIHPLLTALMSLSNDLILWRDDWRGKKSKIMKTKMSEKEKRQGMIKNDEIFKNYSWIYSKSFLPQNFFFTFLPVPLHFLLLLLFRFFVLVTSSCLSKVLQNVTLWTEI